MLNWRFDGQPVDDVPLIRFWKLKDGTDCVLMSAGPVLELRLIDRGVAIRECRCSNIEDAREVARQWRTDYEVDHPCSPSSLESDVGN